MQFRTYPGPLVALFIAACASGQSLDEQDPAPLDEPDGASGGAGAASSGGGRNAGGSGAVTGGAGAAHGGEGARGGAGGAADGGEGGRQGVTDAGVAPDGSVRVPPSANDGGLSEGGRGDSGCSGAPSLPCPLGVVVGALAASSPALGGSGGGAFSRVCGSGQVLTGFDVRFTTSSSGEIRQLRPECSSVQLVPLPTTNAFSVRTDSPVLLDVTGNDTGANYETDRCPEDQIVVGIVARVAGDEVRRFGFLCGNATLAPSTSTGRWELTVGPVSFSSPERGRDPGPVTTLYSCPSGTVATELAGRSGDRIDQVQLGCSPLLIELPCADADGGVCFADVAETDVIHSMTVSEDGTASLSCSSGTISAFSSTYGDGCSGTCPVDCGQCSPGATSCSITYDNATCGDCSQGCTKPGTLEITCR